MNHRFENKGGKMKIVFTGTNHTKDEEEVEVILEYVGEDVWTFTLPQLEFTISDLCTAIQFLKENFD